MANLILSTENLGITFGGLKAVSEVNLNVYKNEIVGLIGPNGAGKTTVFKKCRYTFTKKKKPS